MGIAIASFLAVFLLVLSAGLLVFYRETIQARIASVINPQVKQQKTLKTTILDTRDVLEGVVERFEKVIPRSAAEVGVIQQRLIRAGAVLVDGALADKPGHVYDPGVAVAVSAAERFVSPGTRL